MIGQLNGLIQWYDNTYLLIMVNGVGYEVEAPLTCQNKFKSQTTSHTIYTHLVIREDANLLFGFSAKNIRDVFRVLIKASGIGPKCALAMLSHFSVAELIQVIENQAVNQLVAIKGVGAKLAQKMVVELKGSLISFVSLDANNSGLSHDFTQLNEVKAALESLGYHTAQADKAARHVIKNNQSDDLSRESWIKQALKLMHG